MSDKMRVTSLMGDTDRVQGPTRLVVQFPELIAVSFSCADIASAERIGRISPLETMRGVYQKSGQDTSTFSVYHSSSSRLRTTFPCCTRNHVWRGGRNHLRTDRTSANLLRTHRQAQTRRYSLRASAGHTEVSSCRSVLRVGLIDRSKFERRIRMRSISLVWAAIDGRGSKRVRSYFEQPTPVASTFLGNPPAFSLLNYAPCFLWRYRR